MPILKGSNDHRRPPSSLIKIWRILLWRTQNSSCNFEAVWGQYGLKCLIFVHFQSNIILKLHFVSWCCLEALFHKPDFTSKTKDSQNLASGLNTTLRVVKLYLVQIDGHWPCQFPHWGLWPQIHRFLVMIGFWVRQSKIRQILIRMLGRLLWSFVPFKMDIFWILAKFWISKVILWEYLCYKKWEKWCYKCVNSSRKHPVLK